MRSEIARLHARYLSGTLSPVAVTERHLAAAHGLGQTLNAFTQVLDGPARAAASQSAQRYAAGEPLSLLDGVPISVKDLMHVAGTPTTCGSKASDPRPAAGDATVVARLRALGAIVFAKCNLLEYAYGVVHPDFGPARNPWNLEHSPGGSSSGSAAAVAAGIGFASIGTDTAGSVRGPAALCGVVGLKPTLGALSTDGVIPLAPSLDHVGVLARTVEDTRIVFEALSDRSSRTEGTRPLRVGLARLDGAELEVERAVDDTVARLRAEGVEVVDVEPLPWRVANAAAYVLLYAEALEVHGSRLAPRWHGYSPAIRARLLAGGVVSGADYVRAKRLQTDLRAMWDAALERDGLDAMVSATTPAPAPRQNAARPAGPSQTGMYTSPYALCGVPAVSVPVALGEAGLPIGLQIAAGEARYGVVLDLADRAMRDPWPRPPHFADPFGEA